MTEGVNGAQLNPGDVEVMLGDTTLVLKPTRQAATSISRVAGGIRPAMQKIVDLDMDTIVAVIRFGVGADEIKSKHINVEDLVWANGVTDSSGEVAAKLVEYLGNLTRGGRPAS